MRILVTGVTTALGRAFSRQLLAAGHEVSGIAWYPHGCLDPGVDVVYAPLSGSTPQRLADEAQVVVHLAPIEPAAPGSAGINGVVQVTHAAARAGARLIFVSAAAGQPRLYREAETLVSTSWAPSLVVRIAPPVGRQADWMVCRTVATLLRAKGSSRSVRLLHVDDLIRFLTLAVTVDATGVVDLATPDTTSLSVARGLLNSAAQRPRRPGTWAKLTPDMDLGALQDDWRFEFGWSAAGAVADAARGLTGRKLDAGGATELTGHLPLPVEVVPRTGPPDGKPLGCAAPDGLEGEFDDRIDPRFPVFSAATVRAALPGPLTPMTLDVQLAGLRAANRAMSQVMALGGVVAAEWASRAIAVFGHRPYVCVSTGVIAAGQLPGWDEQALVRTLLSGSQVHDVLPRGRPPLAGRLLGSAAKAVAVTRALAILRHLKSDTAAYSAAATAEHLAPAQLRWLSDASLQARIGLLRDRIHQGWSLTALWVMDNALTTAVVEPNGAHVATSGVGALLESERVAEQTADLATNLRRDRRMWELAERGDLDGIRGVSYSAAAAVDAAVTRLAHRGPGEVELANPTFGDDPAMLLTAAATAPAEVTSTAHTPTTRLPERVVANSRQSRELAYDTTMRFTHELRMTLRELGSRRVAAELIEIVDDVYYLTCDELLTMPADARLRVKRRRAERERLQALRLPDVVDHTWHPLDAGA